MDYTKVYDKMEAGKLYTAAQLGQAPASMSAMVRRGLVEATNSSPKKYKRVEASKFSRLKSFTEGCEYFTVTCSNRMWPMLCYWHNGELMDCYGGKWNSQIPFITEVEARKVKHTF